MEAFTSQDYWESSLRLETEGEILLSLWRERSYLTYGSTLKYWLDGGREADTWND